MHLDIKQKIGLGLIGVLLLVNVFAFKEVFILAGNSYLEVDILDVGQGDSLFIKTPHLRTIIIDGGPDATVLEKLASRLPFWQKRLDMVILTHPDSDHLMGVLAILKKYQIDHIVWSGMVREGANYQEWLSLLQKAQQQGSHVIIAKKGLTIASGGAVLELLHPFENIEGLFFKETNDTGIVSRLDYRNVSFLFTADISSKLEQKLIDAGTNISANVLKVGHHGSKYSTAEAFLDAVHPLVATISVGAKNTYGHPTREVLQRLQNFGITTLRTDQQGDICFLSDGENISLK